MTRPPGLGTLFLRCLSHQTAKPRKPITIILVATAIATRALVSMPPLLLECEVPGTSVMESLEDRLPEDEDGGDRAVGGVGGGFKGNVGDDFGGELPGEGVKWELGGAGGVCLGGSGAFLGGNDDEGGGEFLGSVDADGVGELLGVMDADEGGDEP